MLGGVAKLEKRVEGLGLVAPCRRSRAVPMRGQLHLADELAVEREHLDLRAGVLEVAGDEQVADQTDALQRRPRLRE